MVETSVVVSDLFPIKKEILEEQDRLRKTRDHLFFLKSKFDPVTVGRNIRNLQEASRVQGIRSETRDLILLELEMQKLIRQVLEGM